MQTDTNQQNKRRSNNTQFRNGKKHKNSLGRNNQQDQDNTSETLLYRYDIS